MTISAAGFWYGATYLLPFLFVLGVVVIVHELGHFLVARYFGVTVETFSIGFGRELWSRYDRHGTKWRLAALPLGGYVKFKGDENAASMPSPEALGGMSAQEREGNLHAMALDKRAAVVVAGPVANLILAVVVLTFWFMLGGKPVVQPVVASVDFDSPAERAGILPGDIIRTIGGSAMESIDDIDRIMVRNGDTPVAVTVARGDKEIALDVKPSLEGIEVRGTIVQVGKLGLNWSPARISGVEEGGAGARAGLKPGDIVVQIDGKPIRSFQALTEVVKASAGKQLQITVDRSGQQLTVSATPGTRKIDDDGEEKIVGALNIQHRPDLTAIYKNYGPVGSFVRSVSETYFWIQEPFLFIGKMISGTASPRQVSSVIGIAEVTHDVAAVSFAGLIHLLAVISIQIGLINLFPIPVLDGGHLLFYGIEAIRGRPLSERTMDIGFRIGISLMIMLMLFAMRNDVIHLFRQWG
jgi:regulator of sigma E protease